MKWINGSWRRCLRTFLVNATAEGRITNRRTRIILLPELNQFYDLLNPSKIPSAK